MSRSCNTLISAAAFDGTAGSALVSNSLFANKTWPCALQKTTNCYARVVFVISSDVAAYSIDQHGLAMLLSRRSKACCASPKYARGTCYIIKHTIQYGSVAGLLRSIAMHMMLQRIIRKHGIHVLRPTQLRFRGGELALQLLRRRLVAVLQRDDAVQLRLLAVVDVRQQVNERLDALVCVQYLHTGSAWCRQRRGFQHTCSIHGGA